jgi:hypothetical protein
MLKCSVFLLIIYVSDLIIDIEVLFRFKLYTGVTQL